MITRDAYLDNSTRTHADYWLQYKGSHSESNCLRKYTKEFLLEKYKKNIHFNNINREEIETSDIVWSSYIAAANKKITGTATVSPSDVVCAAKAVMRWCAGVRTPSTYTIVDDSGELVTTVSEILKAVNDNHSEDFIPYDEYDWEEGLFEFGPRAGIAFPKGYTFESRTKDSIFILAKDTVVKSMDDVLWDVDGYSQKFALLAPVEFV